MSAPVQFRRLKKLAESWGAEFVHVPDLGIRSVGLPSFVSLAPFDFGLALDWEQFRVYYDDESKWPGIIHELGHMFATKLKPQASEELYFFGWEYLVARAIGGELGWIKANRDYGTGGMVDFGDLPCQAKRAFLLAWIESAREQGIASGMEPLLARKP